MAFQGIPGIHQVHQGLLGHEDLQGRPGRHREDQSACFGTVGRGRDRRSGRAAGSAAGWGSSAAGAAAGAAGCSAESTGPGEQPTYEVVSICFANASRGGAQWRPGQKEGNGSIHTVLRSRWFV